MIIFVSRHIKANLADAIPVISEWNEIETWTVLTLKINNPIQSSNSHVCLHICGEKKCFKLISDGSSHYVTNIPSFH